MSSGEMNEEYDEEEECNAVDDAEEYCTQKIPLGQSFSAATAGKNI